MPAGMGSYEIRLVVDAPGYPPTAPGSSLAMLLVFVCLLDQSGGGYFAGSYLSDPGGAQIQKLSLLSLEVAPRVLSSPAP
ncbi:hypothetical protein GALMADRAFT_258333 [Galerina marginata CBS 339.88]|uniref:Uncharacterized protein n=1 Tax=Galerina marginata (strain CBS 339.88) TaxID=685588 RepID=A0A067S915_GALM3|nr:hypothetical protein GALMADRAFT_258333 [Galerina marginata CBS 339.88]